MRSKCPRLLRVGERRRAVELAHAYFLWQYATVATELFSPVGHSKCQIKRLSTMCRAVFALGRFCVSHSSCFPAFLGGGRQIDHTYNTPLGKSRHFPSSGVRAVISCSLCSVCAVSQINHRSTMKAPLKGHPKSTRTRKHNSSVPIRSHPKTFGSSTS